MRRIEQLKKIWGRLDIKGWRYRGSRMANPLLILWRLIWLFPFKAALAVACLFALLGFGVYAAQEVWKAGR